MKNELKKSLKIACIFVSSGLFISFLVFFLLFGKGLQILMPILLSFSFFVLFFLLEKIPFISHRPLIKGLISVISVALLCVII